MLVACSKCNLKYPKDWIEEGICLGCKDDKVLCPECEYCVNQPGKTCICQVEGVEKLRAEKREREESFDQQFPLIASSNFSWAVYVHYYGMQYESIGTREDQREAMSILQNLCHEAGMTQETYSQFQEAYHACYGC